MARLTQPPRSSQPKVQEAKVEIWAKPNESFVVGFPGIDTTQPRIEGKVTIRPHPNSTSPIIMSMVEIWLERTETIRVPSESAMRIAKVKTLTDKVGDSFMLWREGNKPYAEIVAMDLPFRLMIPTKHHSRHECPPASLHVKTADTNYCIRVSVQYGAQKKISYHCPVPIIRYDTLTTLPKFHKTLPEPKLDRRHDIELETRLRKEAFGPGDFIQIQVQLTRGRHSKKKVVLQKIEFFLEELITYHHPELRGSRPKPTRTDLDGSSMRAELPLDGILLHKELQMPERPLTDDRGFKLGSTDKIPTQQIPAHARTGFTTTATLYDITYFLVVRV
ncbi:hypothetical protein KEM56_001514 [Ascosphaera pollenicola]|nr:hypothetical protein KEM56_001514 [Ascosphaera pollenicola]